MESNTLAAFHYSASLATSLEQDAAMCVQMRPPCLQLCFAGGDAVNRVGAARLSRHETGSIVLGEVDDIPVLQRRSMHSHSTLTE